MTDKPVNLFPVLNKNKADGEPYILHALKNFTFKVEDINSCSKHAHENYIEIVVVIKHGFYSVVNGVKEIASVGYASVLFPGDNHCFIPIDDKKARIINVTCFTQTAADAVKALFNVDIVGLKQLNLKLSEKHMEIVNLFAKSILSANEDSADEVIASLFSFLFGLYVSSREKVTESDGYPEWLKNYLKKINNLDVQDIKISRLYELSGYSQSRLSVLFRRYVGTTLIQYVNNLRLEQACSLLSKTNHKILYISNKVGFPSILRFNSQFKKRYGLTPLEYRRQLPVNNS